MFHVHLLQFDYPPFYALARSFKLYVNMFDTWLTPYTIVVHSTSDVDVETDVFDFYFYVIGGL